MNSKAIFGSIGMLAVVTALLLTLYAVKQPVQTADAAGLQVTHIDAATTTQAVAVTTSTRVLATTTNPLGQPGVTSFTRVYAVICNANANPVWINIDNDKAANSSTGNVTAVIAAAAGYNACYEITDRNQYNGSITASSTNQTSTTITVKDYVQ